MSMLFKSPPQVDNEWKKRVASEMLSSLSEARCVLENRKELIRERWRYGVRDSVVCRCVCVCVFICVCLCLCLSVFMKRREFEVTMIDS